MIDREVDEGRVDQANIHDICPSLANTGLERLGKLGRMGPHVPTHDHPTMCFAGTPLGFRFFQEQAAGTKADLPGN